MQENGIKICLQLFVMTPKLFLWLKCHSSLARLSKPCANLGTNELTKIFGFLLKPETCIKPEYFYKTGVLAQNLE